MDRIYTLNQHLMSKACDLLKHHSYYDIADVLNEVARQDKEYDDKQNIWMSGDSCTTDVVDKK